MQVTLFVAHHLMIANRTKVWKLFIESQQAILSATQFVIEMNHFVQDPENSEMPVQKMQDLHTLIDNLIVAADQTPVDTAPTPTDPEGTAARALHCLSVVKLNRSVLQSPPTVSPQLNPQTHKQRPHQTPPLQRLLRPPRLHQTLLRPQTRPDRLLDRLRLRPRAVAHDQLRELLNPLPHPRPSSTQRPNPPLHPPLLNQPLPGLRADHRARLRIPPLPHPISLPALLLHPAAHPPLNSLLRHASFLRAAHGLQRRLGNAVERRRGAGERIAASV